LKKFLQDAFGDLKLEKVSIVGWHEEELCPFLVEGQMIPYLQMKGWPPIPEPLLYNFQPSHIKEKLNSINYILKKLGVCGCIAVSGSGKVK